MKTFQKTAYLKEQICPFRVDPYWEGRQKWKYQSCFTWKGSH